MKIFYICKINNNSLKIFYNNNKKIKIGQTYKAEESINFYIEI